MRSRQATGRHRTARVMPGSAEPPKIYGKYVCPVRARKLRNLQPCSMMAHRPQQPGNGRGTRERPGAGQASGNATRNYTSTREAGEEKRYAQCVKIVYRPRPRLAWDAAARRRVRTAVHVCALYLASRVESERHPCVRWTLVASRVAVPARATSVSGFGVHVFLSSPTASSPHIVPSRAPSRARAAVACARCARPATGLSQHHRRIRGSDPAQTTG